VTRDGQLEFKMNNFSSPGSWMDKMCVPTRIYIIDVHFIVNYKTLDVQPHHQNMLARFE
jgi:hypothetical protein